MFDGIETDQRRILTAQSPLPDSQPETAPARRPNWLDGDAASEMHARLLDSYITELARQEENRYEMAVDEDFYDSIQWEEDDAAQLRDRGQVPLVYNVISASVNWVIGTEKRGRSDFKVLPRTKEDGKPAEKKTGLLKYLSDVNRTPFHRSRAFEDAVKVGVGWLEDGWQDDGGEPVYSRYESWRNMLWDSAATELDLSDARYMHRSKFVDEDIAIALAPKRQHIIASAIDTGDGFLLSDQYGDEAMDSAEQEARSSDFRTASVNRFYRRRARVIETWFRKPTKQLRLKGGPFHGELFDPYSPGHVEPVRNGNAIVVDKVLMRMYCALYTSAGLLYFGPSPYRHNQFPFTPIWGFRRGRDGLPYGMIRGLRGPQMDVNKRAAKALHILSTSKIIMDEDALPKGVSIEEFLEEAARPDAVIRKKKGSELKIDADRDLADAHLHLMTNSIAMIQQASGVTDENLGRQTNAKAGVAIKARQQQGSTVTTGFFDNLRLANQIQGEKQLSLVEQFMDEQKQFRITNMRGSPQFMQVNDGLPENDIVRSKADFVISEADWRASVRQAAAESLIDAMKLLPPELAAAIVDMVVENMDLPNRDEIVQRIRAVTGQRDPDADEPTPEEQARAQAQAEAQQIQRETAIASLRKLMADAGKSEAQTQQLLAQIAGTNVATQKGAIDAAREVVMTPGVVPAADKVLHEAGFKSRTEQESQAAAEAAQQPPHEGAQPGA